MKLCAGHIHDLDHAVRRKGMGSLIHPNEAERFALRWLRGVALYHEFDPLVVSILEIQKKATECAGGVLEGCPLCDMARMLQLTTLPASWIDNVTDAVLLTAKYNGLMN